MSLSSSRPVKRFNSGCLVLGQGKLLPQLMQEALYQKADVHFRMNKSVCKMQVTRLSPVSSNMIEIIICVLLPGGVSQNVSK